MRKITLSIIFLFIVTPSSAMAADWPQFLGDSLHTSKSSEILEPPLSLKWSFSADDKFISSAAVKNGKVFIGSKDRSLYALNEPDGSLSWSYAADDGVDSSPFVTDSRVYFSSKDGYVYCVNSEDGALIWKVKTEGTHSSSPVLDGGTVFVGAGFPNKEICALDAETGSELWSTPTGQMVYSSAAVLGDYIYIGSNDGKIYSIDKDSGTVKWTYKTNGKIYYVSPTISGGKLFVAPGNFDWGVYAVNINNGQQAWSFTPEEAGPTPTYVSSAAIGNGDVYVVSGYGLQYLYSLSAATGALNWKSELDAATRLGFSATPVVTDSTVYVATSSGKLRAFETATGTLSWEHDLGAQVLSSPIIANGTLYVATLEGVLYAFDGS